MLMQVELGCWKVYLGKILILKIIFYCEEESRRLKLLKITEEAEQKRLAAEYEQRKNQRLRREIEERELEEAQALLQEAEKRVGKKKGSKKPVLDSEKLSKQALMQLALTEQLRERQEMEKKLQKLAKTMDYLERAKREEAAPLIEASFQQRLLEERMVHERNQQLSKEGTVLCLIFGQSATGALLDHIIQNHVASPHLANRAASQRVKVLLTHFLKTFGWLRIKKLPHQK
ncbi:eukaryotic translation initiation factor 3 subunit A-like isoform X2 [Cucumis melo]|uniref:Eukaryotic translation initiation factor 3 subunit A-like isoform X2 n=1 Tax=Cucumis melo TaxID=3656 RepID=A0ABM3KV71_CUCME|nr:eukaryotic translation initiation factor 3 subunit A-like isoform X2 [Cucumis melo]